MLVGRRAIRHQPNFAAIAWADMAKVHKLPGFTFFSDLTKSPGKTRIIRSWIFWDRAGRDLIGLTPSPITPCIFRRFGFGHPSSCPDSAEIVRLGFRWVVGWMVSKAFPRENKFPMEWCNKTFELKGAGIPLFGLGSSPAHLVPWPSGTPGWVDVLLRQRLHRVP